VLNTVKSRLFYTAQRVLSQERRNQIKHWLASRRKEWARLYVLRHGQFTARDLVDQIRQRIKGDFEILMVHSAYDRLLPMYSGKHQEIIQELLSLCGKDRTLVMPAFVLGGKSGDPLEFYKTHSFDAKRTPSEMGLLTELFRRMPGARRSLHPTHSITALGPLAERLTATHHQASTPSGRGTPFEIMAQRKAAIVGLGVEYYRCMTQIHAAEDMAGDHYPIKFEKEHARVTMIDENASKLVYDLTVFKTGMTMNCGIVRSLLSRDELQEWSFKGVQLFITSANKVTNRLIEAAQKGITIYGCYKV
jgi:aminoglycoside 3-N-acetyltransferase